MPYVPVFTIKDIEIRRVSHDPERHGPRFYILCHKINECVELPAAFMEEHSNKFQYDMRHRLLSLTEYKAKLAEGIIVAAISKALFAHPMEELV